MSADVIDSFIVEKNGNINGETQLGFLSVVNRKTFQQKGTKPEPVPRLYTYTYTPVLSDNSCSIYILAADVTISPYLYEFSDDIVVKLIDFMLTPHATTSEMLAEKDQLSQGKKCSTASKKGTSSSGATPSYEGYLHKIH
ncbi:DEK, C-terminal [Artemisia annua]|uniref:DEK, C-terminal n=1 Tax=Artemisia annua TaxID=35608 RepID=A0A2U1P8R2_ARTAN|nr:DEK, C-terminal [Artemisia annua]